VVDVGGGDGTALASLLAANAETRGILFDLPSVVEHATRRFEQAGLPERVDIQGGDFFQSVPPGGDVYVLKGVLHDWDDAPVTRILQSCRSAMAPGSALLVIETEFGSLLDAAGFSLGRVIPTATPRLSLVETRLG
jgi:O-methyltransferase domain